MPPSPLFYYERLKFPYPPAEFLPLRRVEVPVWELGASRLAGGNRPHGAVKHAGTVHQGRRASSAVKTKELGEVGQMPAGAFTLDFERAFAGIPA